MSAALHHEPARYGMTGAGVGLHQVRGDFFDAADGYVIDAPVFVPRGSVKSREHRVEGVKPYHYLSHTEGRP